MLYNLKTLGTVMLLSATLAAPAFAATSNGRVHHLRDFRGAYNQVITPSASQGAVSVETSASADAIRRAWAASIRRSIRPEADYQDETKALA